MKTSVKEMSVNSAELNGIKLASFRSQIMIMAFLVGMEFFNILSRVIFSPLLLNIERELNLSHAQAANFFMLISAGASIATFFSGFISSKISHRRTIILAGLIASLSLIAISFSGSVTLIRILLVLTGVGTGFYLPSAIGTINAIIVPEDTGKAMATHELGPNLSFVTAPVLAGIFLSFMSWRNILLICGTLYLLMTIAFFLSKNRRYIYGLKPNLSNLKLLFGKPSLWIITALFCINVGGEQGVYALLPTYLVSEKGMEQGFVNTMFGFSRVSVIFISLASGWMIDRFSIKKIMTFIVLASGVLTFLIGFSSGKTLLVVVFLQPALIACFFPSGFATVAKIGPRDSTNLILSVMTPLYTFLGAGMAPSLIGLIGEYGSFSLGFEILGLIVFSGVILVFFLRFDSR